MFVLFGNKSARYVGLALIVVLVAVACVFPKLSPFSSKKEPTTSAHLVQFPDISNAKEIGQYYRAQYQKGLTSSGMTTKEYAVSYFCKYAANGPGFAYGLIYDISARGYDDMQQRTNVLGPYRVHLSSAFNSAVEHDCPNVTMN